MNLEYKRICFLILQKGICPPLSPPEPASPQDARKFILKYFPSPFKDYFVF